MLAGATCILSAQKPRSINRDLRVGYEALNAFNKAGVEGINLWRPKPCKVSVSIDEVFVEIPPRLGPLPQLGRNPAIKRIGIFADQRSLFRYRKCDAVTAGERFDGSI